MCENNEHNGQINMIVAISRVASLFPMGHKPNTLLHTHNIALHNLDNSHQ